MSWAVRYLVFGPNFKKKPHTPIKKSNTTERKDFVFKCGPEARKTANDEIKSQEKVKTSKEFKYGHEFEKSCTLQKHIITKHTEQKCKICNKDIKTSIDLRNHVAK